MIQFQTADVVIYGATPGGIGAAVAAARKGRRTVLLEPSQFVGGMMASGLGRTDILEPEASGSIFREFSQRVLRHYTETYGSHSAQVRDCNGGLFFEPSVAARVFQALLAEQPSLTVMTQAVIVAAEIPGSVRVRLTREGRECDLQAHVFIDATYEGDLAALAGAPYTLGREARDDWNEEYAGKLYMSYHMKEVFPGSTGEGDDRIQAYNFRLCLTQNPANFVPITRPMDYRREDYASLIGDVAAGRVTSIRQVLNILPVPNGKTDANNHHLAQISTDLPGENTGYPEGDCVTREAILLRHRSYVQGLLWFLQHDEELPESFREEAQTFGYAADEFCETGHFPPQIYVREARRILGEYMFTENDARLAPGLDQAPIHYDAVAMGDYHIDSHAVRKREPAGQNEALEGFMGLDWLTKTYQIPYGVMVPRQVDGLLVPVAVSATHQGFGTIRMEPVWMQLGFAAGTAAHLAIARGTSVRNLPVDQLQHELLQAGQRISYLKDVPWESPERIAMEFFATRSFFTAHEVRPSDPVTVADAALWIAMARALPGGRCLPALPASDRVLPAGVDMGPRRPTKERPRPREYWQEHPELRLALGRRWLAAASRAAEVPVPETAGEADRFVRRGEFCTWLYALITSRLRP
ncbi:MAG TPA: FAD-dependent oxidoreductase [Symbiobacteriaceae bacterium]|nr:FAD-dependent oxidoreductase [Symbiobacteriaceae bacterium]